MRPTDDMVDRARPVLRRIRDAGHERALAALAARLPGGTGSTRPEDAAARELGAVLSGDPGGAFRPGDDDEFWRLVDASGDGPVPERLIRLLDELATAPATPAPGTAGTGTAAVVSVQPVPGESYRGWWQGYHQADGVWRYAWSGDGEPGPAASWEDRPRPAPARMVSIQPVPGDGYAGWWQGYDSVDGVWRYAHGAAEPGPDASWSADLSTPDGNGVGAQDADDVYGRYLATAIAQVRARGVTPEEMSDEALADVFAAEVAAELP